MKNPLNKIDNFLYILEYRARHAKGLTKLWIHLTMLAIYVPILVTIVGSITYIYFNAFGKILG